LAVATPARAITVVTVGKSAVLRRATGGASALFRIGRDPAFATLVDPTCAGGGSMTLQVASYPVATARVDALPKATLPCAGWKRQGDGYVYRDPAGTTGGVQKVVYARSRFLARFGGSAYRHVPGPVGYAELWIEIAGTRLNVRLHNFKTNGADRIVARRPSAAAAEGEAGFWRVLHGDDHSTDRQDTALLQLTKAVKRDKKDGWSTVPDRDDAPLSLRAGDAAVGPGGPTGASRHGRRERRVPEVGAAPVGRPYGRLARAGASPPPPSSAWASRRTTLRSRRRAWPTSRPPSRSTRSSTSST
jgi:hypothetical protein